MDINIKITTLKQYLDKTQILSILCDYHYQFYNKINYIFLLPLIIGSSVLTILNTSTLNEDILKYINIITNGSNALLMSLMTQYKLNDRITTYKTLYSKFTKLSHLIENKINTCNMDTNIDDIINQYDVINDDNPYGFLGHYKNKIIKKYGKTKALPNSLALEQTESDLVITNV